MYLGLVRVLKQFAPLKTLRTVRPAVNKTITTVTSKVYAELWKLYF